MKREPSTAEELQRGDQRFHTLAETTSAAIFIYQGNSFRYVNRAAEAITGYTRNELLHLNFWELVHPEDREVVRERGLARQEGDQVPARYEFKIVTKSGEERWVDFTAGRMDFEGAPAALGTVFDITERKRAEEAVRRAAQRLEALQEIERAVLAAQSSAEIARAALERIRRLVPCQRASVVLFDRDLGMARVMAVDEEKVIGPVAGATIPLRDFSAPEVLGRGPTRYLENLDEASALPAVLLGLYREGVRSVISAPLIEEGKVVGELNLCATEPGAFRPEHREILREVTTQLAVGLENARLLESERRARQTADILRAASLALTRSMDLEAVFRALLDYLRQLIPFESANIMLREDGSRFVIRAATGYADPVTVLQLGFDAQNNTIVRRLARERKSILIADTGRVSEWEKTPVGGHVRCWLAVPLVAGDTLIGTFSLDHSQPGMLTAEHQKLAEALAGQAAVAIQNAQLYGQSRRYTAELEQRAAERREAEALQAAIYRISEAANSAPTLDELYRSIHTIVGELMPARNFYIALHNEAAGLLSFPYFVDEVDPPPPPKKLGRGLTEYVLRTGKPLLASPEVFSDLVQEDEADLIGAPSIDWLGVPLRTNDRTFGVLVVQTYTEGVRFSEKDKNILQFVSNQIAMVVERRRAEEGLRTSEERYRELVENANDIIYTHDLAGHFTSLNSAGERITGFTREEILRKNIRDLLTPEQVERATKMTQRKLGGESPTTYELEIAAKDGRRLWLEVNSRLTYQDGKAIGVQGVARDITGRKELEVQLRQAQKMEAVGRLAGGIAHDFNNLLAVLMGYTELMMEQLEPGGRLHKSASEIGKAAERAANLTRQLLAFSRQQMLAPRVLNLNTVLGDMEDLLRRLIREDVSLRITPGAGLWSVKADPGQVEQVILNLVLNARDAMPHGGKLIMETRNIVLDEAYTRRRPIVQAGSYVQLAVSDNGVGMSPETQAHIFEPFFTTKEKGKGTGLGLATVYGIVKQSGGYIWVYSEPGHGTAFKVYLPRAAEPADAVSAARPIPGQAESRPTGTILLVEDEVGVREVAREFLASMGYHVLETQSPEDALRLAEQYEGEIDLLLTDVVMPGMGGRELAERVARVRPRAKVLYMSGYTDDAIVHHGVLDPNTAFLQKPFARGALEKKVREVLEAPAQS